MDLNGRPSVARVRSLRDIGRITCCIAKEKLPMFHFAKRCKIPLGRFLFLFPKTHKFVLGSPFMCCPVADEGSRLAGAVLQKIKEKRKPEVFWQSTNGRSLVWGSRLPPRSVLLCVAQRCPPDTRTPPPDNQHCEPKKISVPKTPKPLWFRGFVMPFFKV